MHFLSSWAYALCFGTLALCIMGSNLKSVWHIRVNKQTHSLILFIGGFFGVIACLSAPLVWAKYLSFVLILLDPGFWMLIRCLKIKLRLSKE